MYQGMYLMSHTGSNGQYMQPTNLCVGLTENINNSHNECKPISEETD